MKVGNKMALKSKQNVSTNDVENTVLQGILKVIDKDKMWIGTMTDLRSRLVVNLGKKATLPQSPSALRVVLNRVVNRLRNSGVSVKFGRAANRIRTRYVRFVG
jgi:hypothetical protein